MSTNTSTVFQVPHKEPKTLQEFYDNAVLGIHSQGWKRSHSNMMCRYRQNKLPDDPVRCAIGWSIPDSRYSFEFDSDHCPATIEQLFPDTNILEELRELQQTHDTGWKIDEMKYNLIQFGIQYNLVIPSVLS